MYKLTCDYCFEDLFFDEIKDRPAICTNCNSPLSHVEITNAEDDSTNEDKQQILQIPDGIVLTYQKTNQTIDIPHNEIIILGRQNTGMEVFGDIPQISREHCKIELFNNQYVVTDLNSMNGTYLGSSRRNCLKHKKLVINENDLLHLGRETFVVMVKYRNADGDEASQLQAAEEEEIIERFKCKACGKIQEINLLICDNCGSYGQIEPLDE